MCSCCNVTCYGQTQRHFFVRASKHLENYSFECSIITLNLLKHSNKSAIFDLLLDSLKGSFDKIINVNNFFMPGFFKKEKKIA